MDIEIRHVDRTVVASVTGEVDLATSPALETAIAAGLSAGDRLVVDLLGVTFMDSSGVRSLVSMSQDHPDVEITLVIGGGIVQKLIDVTGLSDLFRIADDVETALDGAGPQSSSST